MDATTGLLITTVIMALGAITFAALSMAFQRSHSRKSVRPFCNIHNRSTETALIVSIQNAGMGPMLIQNIVLLKNQDAPVPDGVTLAEAFPTGFNRDITIHDTNGYVLASLSEVTLLCCSSDSPDHGEVPLLREKYNGCFLYIRYADIYDDSYEKRARLLF